MAIGGGGSWSIHGHADITSRYEVLGHAGSGTYADVYRGRRRSDGSAVALKEVHDAISARREAEALLAIPPSPNVVVLIEHIPGGDCDDDVLVLEWLPLDLAAVVGDARRRAGGGEGPGGIPASQLKRWMLQVLEGIAACHRAGVVHRDLKPENLLFFPLPGDCEMQEELHRVPLPFGDVLGSWAGREADLRDGGPARRQIPRRNC